MKEQMQRQLIILGIGHVSPKELDNLNHNMIHMIDGYHLVFCGDNEPGIKCIYPTFIADEELMEIQKENMKLLNKILTDKLHPNNNYLKQIFRKLKLERVMNWKK